MFLTLLVCNGRAMIIMANQFPYSKFTGYDISKEAIKNAQSQSLTYDNKNVKDVSIFRSLKKVYLLVSLEPLKPSMIKLILQVY